LTQVLLLSLVVVLAALPANAQVVNPADQNPPADQSAPRLHTWEMPPIDVFGKAPLIEEDRIGTYGQPRWTTHRRFSETRVYVIPRGMVDFEYWIIPETPKSGTTAFQTLYEIEFGLPGRVQLDLYAVGDKVGYKDGAFALDGQKAEVRWALADWGKIPGNPTLYLEWNELSGVPDHLEAKVLLGGQITTGWHWGSNLVWDHELSGAQQSSNEWTTGVSRTVRDSRVGIGLETQLALVNSLDANGRRGAFATELLIGPSLQFRPLPQMHIDFAPLFGVTTTASRAKTFVVMGWEF
jgi:hypothetical protein